jgi:hypothetical protein
MQTAQQLISKVAELERPLADAPKFTQATAAEKALAWKAPVKRNLVHPGVRRRQQRQPHPVDHGRAMAGLKGRVAATSPLFLRRPPTVARSHLVWPEQYELPRPGISLHRSLRDAG